MKISINDECGSMLDRVFTLNGEPATKEADYAPWTGEFHKNGKWSYYEGGVHIKNGLVVWTQRSTHRSSNNITRLKVIKDNVEVDDYCVFGYLSETPEWPPCPEGFDKAVWRKVITTLVAGWGDQAHLDRWAAVENFN